MKYIKTYESTIESNIQMYLSNLRLYRTIYLRTKDIEYKEKFTQEKDKLNELVMKKFTYEFSKYLKLSETNTDYLTFLLEPDYGVKVNFEKNGLGSVAVVIHTIFADNRYKTPRFAIGGIIERYKAGQELSIKDFVSNYIIKLKAENIKRKINKEKRELKKLSKKFNI